jgi:hypothetical protein
MGPEVLGQPLVGRVRPGQEDQVGQLVFQAAAGHGQAVPADFARRVTVTQIQAGPERLSHPARETDRSTRRRHRHPVGPPQEVVEALRVPGVLELVVIISDAPFSSLLVEAGGAAIFFLKRKCLAGPRPTFRTLRDATRRGGSGSGGTPSRACPATSGCPARNTTRTSSRPCLPIDLQFDYRRFGWVAVVAANDEERTQAPLGTFYVCDGAHKSLVLAKRLRAGETKYHPVEVLPLIPRR